MGNDFFNASGTPSQGGGITSPNMRAEFSAVAAGFDKLPTLTGNGYKVTYINASGTAMDVVGGSGLLVLSASGIPTVLTPGTGVAAALAVNVGSAGAPVLFNGAGGTPSSMVGTNITGTASGLTAGNVTTNANLTGHITSVGNAAVLGSFTIGQLNTAISDGDVGLGGQQEALTGYYYPSKDQPFRDMYRSGWLPSWFNQQWGGAQWGTLPDGSFGSVATGSIEDTTNGSFSNVAGSYYLAQGFKVSETATFDAIWVKLYKSGNPTYNLTARIYSDTAGSPNAAIGTASTVSAKTLTSKTDGEWVQFTGLNVALTAGTQYHIVLSSLVAVDATNYINWRYTNAKEFPHGCINNGTSAPVWTPSTAAAACCDADTNKCDHRQQIAEAAVLFSTCRLRRWCTVEKLLSHLLPHIRCVLFRQ